MAKYVYFFGGNKAEGRADMKNLLGGKGANLAEMVNIGLPVPAGFTLTTEVCNYYSANKKYPPELKAEVDRRNASAVAPALADDSAAELAAAFGLGEATGPLVPLIRQWAGHAWTLTTDRGTWTARRLFGPFYEANLETDARLAERADADGIVTPVPVRSVSGNLAETVGGARWRVFTAPPGTSTLAVTPEPSSSCAIASRCASFAAFEPP